MTSCPNKAQLASIYSVNKEPIRFNVAFPAIFQGTFKLMIFVFRWEFIRVDQTMNDVFQFVNIFMAFSYTLYIFFKLVISSD